MKIYEDNEDNEGKYTMMKDSEIGNCNQDESKSRQSCLLPRIYPGMQVTGVAIQEVESLSFCGSFRQSFGFLVFRLNLRSFDLNSFNEKTTSRSCQSLKVSLLQ